LVEQELLSDDPFCRVAGSVTDPNRHALVETLISLASTDGLGEIVDWEQVEAAITELSQNPVGTRDLRKILTQVNDTAIITTLEDWFRRAANARDADARDAKRFNDNLLTPVHRIGLGGIAASALSVSLGTIAAPIALPVLLASTVAGIATGYGRFRLSKRSDTAVADAALIREFALICRDARDSRT
jgi:hypothetical protein